MRLSEGGCGSSSAEANQQRDCVIILGATLSLTLLLVKLSQRTMSFKCPFCPKRLATNQGITSHISQTTACRDKLQTFYENLNAQLEQADAPSPPSEVQDEHDVDVDVEMQPEGPISPPDIPMDVPDESAPSPPRERHRVPIEEVPDEDDARTSPAAVDSEVWIDDYDEEKQAGVTMGTCKTSFKFHREQQKEAGVEPWSPFESEDEWELARWLMSAGVSQKKMDTLLKLKMVIRTSRCSPCSWK